MQIPDIWKVFFKIRVLYYIYRFMTVTVVALKLSVVQFKTHVVRFKQTAVLFISRVLNQVKLYIINCHFCFTRPLVAILKIPFL